VRPPAPTATLQESTWLECIVHGDHPARERSSLIGVLPGEGVGPEVVDAAMLVLRALEEAGGTPVSVELGGSIGRDAEAASGTPLPDEVVRFCEQVFERGGAILNGPGGSRYVYDLRKRFDLFLKISPVEAANGLPEASPLRPEVLEGVDVLVVRENVGGVYQGISEEESGTRGRRVRHAFSYAEEEVRRFLDAAARLARSRRGELTVVAKEAGVPAVSSLWRDCGIDAAEKWGVRCSLVDVDLMAYRLVREPSSFDVVAAPNMSGDVLGDLAAVLLGSRAHAFSGNFTPRGHAVYQTNHGAAYDIAGTDRANPTGQLLSLAMLLRESLGLEREAAAIQEGIRRVWREGWRTDEVAAGGGRVAGTRQMAELVARAAADRLDAEQHAA
jgi:3-isopropylmalate dehydrogenase